jgi:triacylglycerol esterase/lipase EstA (alpha/beta hydrolase family)
MSFYYKIVRADNHNTLVETATSSLKTCALNYSLEHGVPTTLEVPPTKLEAGQEYYLMLRSQNNERAQAYWGVDTVNQATFRLLGSPAPKEPVILVPGMMGSSLNRASDSREVWPNVNEMVLSGSDSYLDDLKLDNLGSQISGKEVQPDKILERASFSVFGQDLVTQNFYGDLVKQFTDRGYVLGRDLFELAYDWRSDLRTETARLQSVVSAALAESPSGKVSIVAHSMGGLLVKQYLASPENASSTNVIVLVGVPQLGAPFMFKVLNYGDNLGFKFPVIQRDLLNPSEVKAISQNMPGAYELLPSRRYVAEAGGYVKDFRSGASKTFSYDETTSFMTASTSDSRNSALLSGAQTFHDVLDQQSITGPKVYNLAACGNASTIGEVRLYDDGKIDIGSVDGDGTVPFVSSMHLADGYINYFAYFPDTGIDHGGLIKDERTTALIQRLAEDVDFALLPGIGKSQQICWANSRTFRFSTHSPVALHIYDSSGRHIGPGEDGGVDLGIPGGSYDKFGENSFVFVPADETYRVVIDGLAPGKFTFKSEILEGLNVVASRNYINVPLVGASTVAEAIFSATAPNPDLSVDNDGNGSVDVSLPPTAELFSSAASDSEPPQINVSGIPTSTIVAGSQFRIIFSASDLLSGIATTSATLDGSAFASGETLSSSSVGRRVVVIRATDKAGNPKVIIKEFEQVAVSAPSIPTPSPSSSQPIPPAQPSNGNGSGSGTHANQQANHQAGNSAANSSGTSSGFATSAIKQVLGAATTTPIAETIEPEVCLSLPAGNLGRGRGNDRTQVGLLQAFLNRELGLAIPLTGFFGPITEIAVKIFQLKYYADVLAPVNMNAPTGFVGKYTLAKMNALKCR